jgi:sulfur carrier protein ThiS
VTVTVNGAGYEVREGQTFADNLRLLDISGTCATFLFGDSRFTICEGGSIRK